MSYAVQNDGLGWRAVNGPDDVGPDETYTAMRPEDPETSNIPRSVTRAQGKAALITAGLWVGVVAFVDAIEDPTEQALARVALDDTAEWRRDSPFLATAAAALGLSETQLDDLFVTAAAIIL
ncbi:hypothetical protein ABRZ04_04580 [Castellaniella ginsengisoli]|uniref:Uncharacterized protein n=1 Tax=Castellaniella ginsengisoli TaxID=546114 RepID=A0AB39D2W7_9BURK